MKKNATKHALLTSIISLLLCVSMLVGATFAWFTDSVTSANNIIKSGNLDVELYYMAEGDTDWTKVTADTNVFMENALWEPGHTEVVKLKIVNEGTLALKYQLGVNVAGETGSVNALGDNFNLSDHIKFSIIDDAMSFSREQAIAAAEENGATPLQVAYNSDITALMPLTEENTDNEDIVTMVVYMPTTVGNETNHAKDAKQPTINLGINLFATQVEAESDSFGNDYDKDVQNPVVDIVTVPENNTADVELSTETVKVTVPAEVAEAGAVYKMVASDEKVATDDVTGATTVSADVTLYKNDAKVSDGDTIYEVKFTIAKFATISAVTHNGVAMTAATTGADQTYTYDSATGELTIYTKSFSPFAVTYTDFKDYVVKTKWQTDNTEIFAATGSDFLPVASVNPQIAAYSIFDGNTRLTNEVRFRFSKVEKQDIDENSYKVSFEMVLLDENGKALELKPGRFNPYNQADPSEYLKMYVNLLEIPAGYAVSDVKVNGTSFTKTTGEWAATGEYMIGIEGKDVYLQSMEAGLFEIIVTKAN